VARTIFTHSPMVKYTHHSMAEGNTEKWRSFKLTASAWFPIVDVHSLRRFDVFHLHISDS
jgi:hypothetical protein